MKLRGSLDGLPVLDANAGLTLRVIPVDTRKRRRNIIRMPSHETENVRAKSPLLGQPIEQVPQ